MINGKKIVSTLLLLTLLCTFITIPTYAYEVASNDRIWVTEISALYNDPGDAQSITYEKANGGYRYRGTLYPYRSYKTADGWTKVFFQGWLYNTGIGVDNVEI